nr:DUF6576 domain-containing protein [Chryseobacterium sp. Leaf405]
MSELLILLIIIVAIVGFFNREWIKNRLFPDEKRNYTIDDKFNSDKREREKEIDSLLSKMGKNGINDLSAKDRKRLDELSKKKKNKLNKDGGINCTPKEPNGAERTEKCDERYGNSLRKISYKRSKNSNLRATHSCQKRKYGEKL